MAYGDRIIATMPADRLRNQHSNMKLKLSSSWRIQQRDIVVDDDAVSLIETSTLKPDTSDWSPLAVSSMSC